MAVVTVTNVYGTGSPIPYTNEEVSEIQSTQSGNLLILVHPNWPPASFTRYGPTDWRFEYINLLNGPYLPQQVVDKQTSLSLTGVTDSLWLTSTNLTDFAGLIVGDLVEYDVEGQKALGQVTTTGSWAVIVTPLENRSLVLSREVYSPGLYTSWDVTNNVPIYNTTIAGAGVNVAFSNTQVATRSTVGNYLRFSDKPGNYYWMLVTGIGDILQQGAYGILAKGNILSVYKPTGVVSRSNRSITGTLTSTTGSFFNGSTDVGRYYRLNFNEFIIHAKATAISTDKIATVSLSDPVPLTIDGTDRVLNSNTVDWRKGAFFTGNYPATVTFHGNRLVFGGTALQPQTFFMSKVSDWYNFASTDSTNHVLDSSAIDATISSDTTNVLLWLSTHTTLLAGTVGSEWIVTASTQRNAITPSNITTGQQSSFGSEFAKCLTVGHSVFYIQRGGYKLREMVYDYSADSYSSMDVTVFSEHILREHGGAVQLAYQALPESVIWCLCYDGTLCSLTYEPDQKVYSWSRHTIGGGGVVTAISTQLDNDESSLYMVVSRVVNGATVITNERLRPVFEPTSLTDLSDAIFLDRYISLTPIDVSLDGGTSALSAFAGHTVGALIDGVSYKNIAVDASGNATLPRCPTTTCYVGYTYSSIYKSFPLETQGKRGTTQGKIKSVTAINVRRRNSIGMSYGPDLNTLFTEPAPAVPVMDSDDKYVPLPNNYDTRGAYYVVQDHAYPLTLVAVMPTAALRE